ncbi:MAG: aspartate aminotransferase family protein [Spirochaetae bacterium HGW-Spirochaetae-7]|nr:MAG: aspartate aminotransferase family protein [Spirochaetae bacterium HGW-Spirochaetae-7]
MKDYNTPRDASPDELLAGKARWLVPCSKHFYERPPHFVRGLMQYLWDSEGKRYLDFFSGVSVNSCGHCNPAIVEAAAAQMARLQHLSSIYLTAPAMELAERLAAIMPGGISRSFFCNSGSEANEGAFLAARLHTGNRRLLSIEGGLHGRTFLGMATTGIPMWRTDPFLPAIGEPGPDATVLPGIYDKASGRVTDENCARSIAAIGQAMSAGDAAAIIVEPIQGNGGIVPLPDNYLLELRRLASASGVLMIADEVQTGFGRSGSMFAVGQSGVEPDIVTVAKALGNGTPVAAYCATEAVASSFTRPSASTLGGNPVSAAAAIAVLDYIDAEGLVERAAALGARLESGLRELAARHPCLADVRGRGLMLGAELRKPDGSPDPEGADLVLEFAKDRGLIVGKNGLYRNVLAFQPPLVIVESDVDFALGVIEAALQTV